VFFFVFLNVLFYFCSDESIRSRELDRDGGDGLVPRVARRCSGVQREPIRQTAAVAETEPLR